MSSRKRNNSKTRPSAPPTTPGPAAADSSADVSSATPQRGGQQVIAGNGASPGANARAGPDATTGVLSPLRVGDHVLRRNEPYTVIAVDTAHSPPSYTVRHQLTGEPVETERQFLSLPTPPPAPTVAGGARGAGGGSAVRDTPTMPAPKPKYSARDPSAGFLAANPSVSKIDADAFSTWKANFILHLHRTLQGMRFKELKSVIEETEVGGTTPAVQRFTEKDGKEVVEEGNPRTDVAEYGLQFVEALRANKEMALPVNTRSKAFFWKAFYNHQPLKTVPRIATLTSKVTRRVEEHTAAWTKPSRPSNGSNLVVIPRTYTGGRSPRSWVQLH